VGAVVAGLDEADGAAGAGRRPDAVVSAVLSVSLAALRLTAMGIFADDGRFVVAPDIGLVLWTIYCFASLGAAVVTGLKGRWGWLVVGFFTGGLAWFYGATLPAVPDSTWERRARRRRQRAGTG
jgi:hypothetical protein